MFSNFSENKTRYNKGQIFPFLIAIVCVVVILIMITVNLGQLSIFKTDTSNAADAAALAAVSVLSSTLLGLGLKSEQMCGRAIEVVIMIAIALWFFWPGWIYALLIYIAFIIEAMVNIQMAQGEARMGWSNAKRSALQYTFQNIGVDEPRPTFNEFLKAVYGITDPNTLTSDQINAYSSIYSQGDDPAASTETRENIRRYTQGGFSRFMQDPEGGYWQTGEFGEIEPGEMSPIKVVSGYGWNDPGNNTDPKNSYDDGNVKNYQNYDNWVEAQVIGASLYAIDAFSWVDQFRDCLINLFLLTIGIPWWLDWMKLSAKWVLGVFVFWIMDETVGVVKYAYPMGIDFFDADTDGQVNKNYITVKTTRYKRSKDLGLWNFRYGSVSSNASAHAFQEHPDSTCDYETIRPVALEELFTKICKFGCCDDGCGWNNEKRHLFETELTQAF